jgi:serine/threonine protein kinase
MCGDAPSANPLVGQTISHYRIVEKLGSCGVGIVYKAEATQLGRFVALKFFPDDVARDPPFASARNEPEAIILRKLSKKTGRYFVDSRRQHEKLQSSAYVADRD